MCFMALSLTPRPSTDLFCVKKTRQGGRTESPVEPHLPPITCNIYSRTSLGVQWLRLHFQCKGCGFDPWSENLRSCMMCSVVKKKKRIYSKIVLEWKEVKPKKHLVCTPCVRVLLLNLQLPSLLPFWALFLQQLCFWVATLFNVCMCARAVVSDSWQPHGL